MAQFCIEIAGSVAAVTSLFESTPHHFRPYLTDREPDFSIEIIDADLRFEQAAAESFRIPFWSGPPFSENSPLIF